MNWQVAVRPEAVADVEAAAEWYEEHEEGLGKRFKDEIITVFDALAEKSVDLLPTSSEEECPVEVS
ncbi:MAG TPA: hypothetical protein VGH19_01830 [Verrucomicrobiae bacterium]